ncbi:hypothetical protein [Paracoccus alkenifer]|uniref:Uncharacterized protein n=1 Tax=Paracoccus alkenifer TaxID=65735 RepID=A0A1H6JIH7_9RHOB|nr:hypothetical protein [Paracoccus alkenifer]SEH60610.1 hypothetical protein SAMN04488075_0322 [Paracoccus alkenifer]
MSEFFYTLDLGEEHGKALQKVAAFWGHDDVEEFASELLCDAIRQAEVWLNSEIYRMYEDEISILRKIYKERNERIRNALNDEL